MSPWLKVYDDLPRHPKTTRLCRTLNSDRALVVGCLVCLWSWCFSYAEDGDLSKWSDQDIAEGARWTGDPKTFVKALKKDGWIEKSGVIHDWLDYSGAYLTNRERQRKYKSKVPANPVEQPLPSERIAVTSPLPSALKNKNKKDQEHCAVPALSPEFLAWWESFGKVGGRADANLLFCHWVRNGASPDDLTIAATNYRAQCLARNSFQQHGRTFLAKTPNRWQEWVAPEQKPSGNGKRQTYDAASGQLVDIDSYVHGGQ